MFVARKQSFFPIPTVFLYFIVGDFLLTFRFYEGISTIEIYQRKQSRIPYSTAMYCVIRDFVSCQRQREVRVTANQLFRFQVNGNHVHVKRVCRVLEEKYSQNNFLHLVLICSANNFVVGDVLIKSSSKS